MISEARIRITCEDAGRSVQNHRIPVIRQPAFTDLLRARKPLVNQLVNPLPAADIGDLNCQLACSWITCHLRPLSADSKADQVKSSAIKFFAESLMWAKRYILKRASSTAVMGASAADRVRFADIEAEIQKLKQSIRAIHYGIPWFAIRAGLDSSSPGIPPIPGPDIATRTRFRNLHTFPPDLPVLSPTDRRHRSRWEHSDIHLPRLETLILAPFSAHEDFATDYLMRFIVPGLRRLQIPETFISPDPTTQLATFIEGSQCKLKELHVTGERSLSTMFYRNQLPDISFITFN
ncbi:hypothetical protein C8R47DRAFT_1076951 [Mycena vitilis]|nr:hypothetical protein C8R47DRAFT_1076951 [Mycena vitilis]